LQATEFLRVKILRKLAKRRLLRARLLILALLMSLKAGRLLLNHVATLHLMYLRNGPLKMSKLLRLMRLTVAHTVQPLKTATYYLGQPLTMGTAQVTAMTTKIRLTALL